MKTEYTLTLTPITQDSPFWQEVAALAKEAFPPKEYLPPETLVSMAQGEHFDFWALVDAGRFVGFMVVQTYGGMAYLFFLAIRSALRSKGYGGQALALLRQTYPQLQQVVDLEMLDPTAENYTQRQARRAFYLRNGYQETGLFLTYLGVDYEVLCAESAFDPAAFQALLGTLQIEGFDPHYFRLDASGHRIAV